ncbi:acetyltransferase-like isoleucine patch superfamily enzyme [Pedobacter sp. W3I1]|uniref:acyltransferase n=1 Tax=Pedobacter sp. W3I1 TaxID=3042291 RepID=UPI00277F37DB|nr:acyltransferase [Pedobacter sp. W3I1]MDQ0640899.1 acetyltransferase-like isoleucine patch superfamily enzyme [Pedobacter sp. W3I1]
MIKKIKSFIRDKIISLLIKNYNSSYNPFGINFGLNSSLYSPMQIDGGENIKIGVNSTIGRNAWLSAIEKYGSQKFNPKITIGDHVNIGNYPCITAIEEITIEECCLLSEYVYISDHTHGIDPTSPNRIATQDLISKGKVVIGKNSFIGYRVSILPGVILGKNCVVGAHSVVTKSFPDYSMIAGNPAKLIKKYSFEKLQWENID